MKPIAENWVINASPVIALSRVGQVKLLTRLPQRASLPHAVVEELSRAPKHDPARRAVDEGLFEIIPPLPIAPELLAWDLGRGETAVLSYAQLNPDWVAVLDDGAARQCAHTFSLHIIGTLAVVLLAKQHGLVASAVQVLQDLRRHDFHLDDAVIRNALARSTGETWPG